MSPRGARESDPERVFERAAAAAGPKPADIGPQGESFQTEKKNWAQRLSSGLAIEVAGVLRGPFKGARIMPTADGKKQEFSLGAMIDKKRTDVSVWDDAAGLIAGVSIKTYSFPDYHQNSATNPEPHVTRYTRNVRRNDMELRDEADTLHRRQPFSVLTALYFLPEGSCGDGMTRHSSFAHVVLTLRKRAGRLTVGDRPDLFELVLVGLHRPDGSVRFFDVTKPPPRNQPPPSSQTLTVSQLVGLIQDMVLIRNTGTTADGRYAPDDPHYVSNRDDPPAGLDRESALEFEHALDDGERAEQY